MEISLTKDKSLLLEDFIEATDTVDYYFHAYIQEVWPSSSKRAAKAGHDRDKVLLVFEKIKGYLQSKRGRVSTDPVIIKEKITSLMALLPDDERASLLQELQQEQLQICQTNRDY